MLNYLFKGFFVSGSLIVAIGSQNAFVLKQGLLKKYIFYICLICFACDFILMSTGVMGLGSFVQNSKVLSRLLAIAGAIFLFYYGLKSFISSFNKKNSLTINNRGNNCNSITKVMVTTLAVTLLNPHVYIDTIVVVGSIAGTFSLSQKITFLIGALTSSFLWFFGLGYGARILSPLFKKNLTWTILDFIIGCIMWWIAITLLFSIMKI